MNCANHSQNPVAAYCRTCGKPLCSSCTRQVMGVVYCENCLAERVSGSAPPPSSYQPPYQPYRGPVPPAAGPNPGLAGILGAIPFGVGAIYCGQYTKGLVYLGIFVFFVVSLSSNLPDYLYPILGITMAFFVIYQIIDSVRTAKAIQAGQPVPDPLGLTAAFSPGKKLVQRKESFAGVPAGAVVLIGLGILFLLHNLGLWFLRPGVLWSLALIAFGMWLFVRRFEPGADPSYRYRGIVGPAVVVTLGVQSLLDNIGIISFGRTLPVLLIVIGVAIVIQRSAPPPPQYYPPQPPSSTSTPPSEPQPPSEVSTEVNNG